MAIKVAGAGLIKTSNGSTTRPTTGRVRAAVFNIWQWHVRGCNFLDLCGGSGAMSVMALQKGARSVVVVEQLGNACRLIRANLTKAAKPEQQFEVRCGDVVRVLPQLPIADFELIYFDPPYDSNLYNPVLALVASQMSPHGVIGVEHRRDRSLDIIPAPLRLLDCRTYGQTSVSFLVNVKNLIADQAGEVAFN